MISLNTDKVFKKISTSFHDKSHGQSRDIWDLYKHNKSNTKNSIANIILNGETFKAFPLKL